jgi:putative transposase
LLQRADHGPTPDGERAGRPSRPSRREQRVAARTKATAAPAWPRPGPPAAPPVREDVHDGEDTGSLAEVVPLRVFDAREEASRWW